MIGTRVNCVTCKNEEVTLSYKIKKHPKYGDVFILIGGPLGFEWFIMDTTNLNKMPIEGWLACGGTEGKWDQLYISGDEMGKVLSEYRKNKEQEG